MSQGSELFDGNFRDILENLNSVYHKHKPVKGDSWKRMSPEELRMLFINELDEFDESDHSYKELLDIILVAIMLAQRIKDE